MDEKLQCPEAQGDCAACGGCANRSSEPVRVVDVHFRNNEKIYYFDPGTLALTPDSHVIIETSRGDEYGICVSAPHTVPGHAIVPPLRKVLRVATEHDERVNAENIEREKHALAVCQQKIEAHGLDMQLVSAECAFDGSKILFFFTAEGRVDFRELVKDLASAFRTRIELRQIGVRDKAKMVGGLGICGRPFCCKDFLDDFQPVSIKMAKTQNLSLNPTKISGTCGRLMCCLKYEQEAYEDLLKHAPKNDSFVDTPDGRGTVTEVNLLRQRVKVRMENAPDTIESYDNNEIYVIRNGKAQKNDPPIPPDFAPISSQPRKRKKEAAQLDPMPDLIYPDDLAAFGADSAPRAKDDADGSPKKRHKKRRPAAPAPDQPDPSADLTPYKGQAPMKGQEAAAPKKRHRPRRRKKGAPTE